MTGLKALVVAVATALGALFAVGCLLAALFEEQGFGRPRDTEPRPGYLALLALGFLASVGIPAFLWRRLFPGSGPAWIVALAIGVIGAVFLLGISLRA
jgi:hypothetical protein